MDRALPKDGFAWVYPITLMIYSYQNEIPNKSPRPTINRAINPKIISNIIPIIDPSFDMPFEICQSDLPLQYTASIKQAIPIDKQHHELARISKVDVEDVNPKSITRMPRYNAIPIPKTKYDQFL